MLNGKFRVLGIDPGLRYTGWGLIDVLGNKLSYVASGRIASDINLSLSLRLVQLYTGLEKVVDAYQPDAAAVEETFVNSNPTSTLKLGLARGVALVMPANHGVEVFEYTANKVKKAVVGVGHAAKEQVEAMVKLLLPQSATKTPDEADALAIAICHSHHAQTNNLMLQRAVS